MVFIKKQLLKKARYIKRSLNNEMTAHSISKTEVHDRKQYYDSLLNTLYGTIHQYSDDSKPFTYGTVEFSGFSLLSLNGDRMGKVFTKDNVIYRGIYADRCGFFIELWETGLLQALSQHGLIPLTEISEYTLKEYPIILRHESVQIIPSKLWTREMIKEASAFVATIKACAERVGYTLHDGHLNNVTFHNGDPMFTDIGSFVKDNGQTTVCNKEIVFTGCYRLLFQSIGNCILSRIQPYDEETNALWLSPRYYDDLTHEYYYALKKYKQFHLFHSRGLTNKLIRNVFDLYDVRPEYIDVLFSDHDRVCEPRGIQDKRQTITSIVRYLKNTSITFKSFSDMGKNGGELAVSLYQAFGVPVITLETDDYAADYVYQKYKNKQINGNVFLFNYLFSCDSVSEDLVKGHVAIALDITNNAFTTQQFRLDSLISSLCKRSTEYILFTYIPGNSTNDKYIPMFDEEDSDLTCLKNILSDYVDHYRISDLTQDNSDKKQEYLIFGKKIIK